VTEGDIYQEASLVWGRKEAISPLISKTDREKVH